MQKWPQILARQIKVYNNISQLACTIHLFKNMTTGKKWYSNSFSLHIYIKTHMCIYMHTHEDIGINTTFFFAKPLIYKFKTS